MTLESDSLYHVNNIVEPTKLKDAKKGTDEKVLLVHEVKGSKLIAVSLPSGLNNEDGFWSMTGFDSSLPSHDLTTKETGNEMVSPTEGGETEFLKRDLDVFSDKNVTEFELPKDCHEIRDICMDEGVASDAKISLLDKEVDGSLMKGGTEMNSLVSDILEVPEDSCPADPVNRYGQQHFVSSAQNSAAEDISCDSSVALGHEAELQSSPVCSDESTSGSTSSFHTAEESEDYHEEATAASNTVINEPTLPENGEVEQGSDGKEARSEANDLPYNQSLVGNSAPTRTDRTESIFTENKDLHQSKDMPKVEESILYFSRNQQSLGESSFSVLTGPLDSGPISYSGPIGYSGSLSVRSDSSIGTSTRSFAFPVLQSEWNSSPVRMAKAERRKRSGWKKGLLCCKF